jgi:hypothetical protein
MTNIATIKELRRIAKVNNGLLRPENIIQEAESEESPLHGCFCWDDTRAAREYRLWQARELIRVVVEVIPQSKVEQRVFVSLSTDRKEAGGGYRVLSHVMTDVDQRRQLLADALNELETIQAKYANLKELAKVFSAVQQVRLQTSNKLTPNPKQKRRQPAYV